ncbi:MAG: diguanylate cyclase [Candidatus Omnitrophica bacterium]|nr:diguanylate cyclase [Candidatus Omnitrophota bacterium]
MNFLKKLSLIPRGLRYKLLIAFCLMSIIPLLVSLYIVRDYIFPPSGDILSTSWVMFFCVIITFLGLVLAKQMVEPVIEMAIETQLIAKGDVSRKIDVRTEDEIGDLGRSINEITAHIRDKIDELKVYGEKTRLINTEIHKKVLVLSSLLQIGENISGLTELEDIVTLIVEKVAHTIEPGYAMIFFPKPNDLQTLEIVAESNLSNDTLQSLEIKPGKGFLGNVLMSGTVIYADSKTKHLKQIEDFKDENSIKNFAAFPIISRNKAIGLLFIGNDADDFEFKTDDLEVLKIFSKQAAIAYESDALTKRAKELEIKDDLTDLYNEKYIAGRLDEEIKRAILYQRPCSYIVFDIDNFDAFRSQNGELATEKALKRVASVLGKNATEIGRAARLSGDGFSLLLPEKNKKEAYKIAEDVRREVEGLELDGGPVKRLTISGGVSENPIDGTTAAELMQKAATGLSIAKTQGKNRII